MLILPLFSQCGNEQNGTVMMAVRQQMWSPSGSRRNCAAGSESGAAAILVGHGGLRQRPPQVDKGLAERAQDFASGGPGFTSQLCRPARIGWPMSPCGLHTWDGCEGWHRVGCRNRCPW